MEIIFHSYANTTHFHKKGCSLGLILKVRVFGTRTWPVSLLPIVLELTRFFWVSTDVKNVIFSPLIHFLLKSLSSFLCWPHFESEGFWNSDVAY